MYRCPPSNVATSGRSVAGVPGRERQLREGECGDGNDQIQRRRRRRNVFIAIAVIFPINNSGDLDPAGKAPLSLGKIPFF